MTMPVTVIAASSPSVVPGFLQAVSDSMPPGVAVIVPGSQRSSRSRQRGPWVNTTPRLARWGEGCGCCTVRADVASKVRRAAEDDGITHALVVLNAGDGLETLVKTFTVLDPHARRLQDVAHLARLVVLAEPSAVVDGVEGRPNAGLVERLELADEVVLHSGQDTSLTRRAEQVLGALNPAATVTTNPVPPFETPAPTRHFSLRVARERAQEQVTTADSDEHERRRFVIHRPMHPGRLLAALPQLAGLWRISGAFWVASRPDDVGFVDGVGSAVSVKHVGTWLAAVPEARHPNGAVMRLKQQGLWSATYGDRCQDLMLAGHREVVEQAIERLSGCLLTDDELNVPSDWAGLAQPQLWTLETP